MWSSSGRSGGRPTRAELERLRVLVASAAGISAIAGVVVAAMDNVVLGAAFVVGGLLIAFVSTFERFRVENDPGQALADVLGREIERARRHQHPLALARVTPTDGTSVDTLRGRIRMLDHAWADGDAVMLLLTETDHAAGERLMERLQADGLILASSVTAFPEDALTSGALIARVGVEPGVVRFPVASAKNPAPAAVDVEPGTRTG